MVKSKFASIVLFLIPCLLASNLLFAQAGAEEHDYLTNKSGKWSVVMTLQPDAASPAQVITGITAERTMVGKFCLHEVMYPAAGIIMPDFKRLADLAWNLNERRWDYMSIDTRITAGIMYFTYQGSDQTTITSFMSNFPNPGMGPDQKGRGQAVYARNVIIKINNDHDMVRQYWRLTDKSEWLAVQYDYTRNQ